MARRRRKEKMEPSPQKFSWKTVKTYPSYELADSHRTELKDKGETVKVHRQRDFFAVKVGTPVKAKEETSNEES